MATYTPHQIKEKYGKIATKYDILEALPEFLGIARVRKNLFRKAQGNILEVAAGTGTNFSNYNNSVWLTAVDISPEMLSIAQKKAHKFKLNARFEVMDAHSLNFPDNSFDTVTSSLSTCTFTDPVKVLNEIARVCKPSGRIFLLEHGRSNKKWINKWLDKKEAAHAEIVGCHWNRDINQILSKAHLKVLSQKDYFFGILHAIEAVPLNT